MSIIMNSPMVITNLFNIQAGDILQIYEGGNWTDMGVIEDRRKAAIAIGKDGFRAMGKPIRIIRR